MNTRVNLASLIVFCIVAVGCKPVNQDSSEQKSLAEFAGGKADKECKGNYEVSRVANITAQNDADKGLIGLVQTSLTAVPEHVQLLFFGAGRIVVADTAEACKKSVAKNPAELSSCRLPDPNNAKKFVLYLDNDPSRIKDDTVLAIATYLSEVFLTGEATQKLFGSDRGGIKAEVGLAYLTDVAEQQKKSNGKGPYNLASFKNYLPKEALDPALIDRPDFGNQARRELLENMRPREVVKQLAENDAIFNREHFYDLVVANSIDSFLCDAKQRNTLAHEFRRTGDEMKMVFNRLILSDSYIRQAFNIGAEDGNAGNGENASLALDGYFGGFPGFLSTAAGVYNNWNNGNIGVGTQGAVNGGLTGGSLFGLPGLVGGAAYGAYNNVSYNNAYNQTFANNLQISNPYYASGSTTAITGYRGTGDMGSYVNAYKGYDNGGFYQYDSGKQAYQWYSAYNQPTDTYTSWNAQSRSWSTPGAITLR